MKKIYLIVALLTLASSGFSQRTAVSSRAVPFEIKAGSNSNRIPADTITSHFVGATPTIYSSAGGFVAGHNNYGDIAKMQQITTSSGGVITDLLFWFGAKQGNSASTITATIWNDAAGVPGAVLGTVSVPFSSIDTVPANLVSITNAAYNTVATFTNPVAVPSGNIFWAGFQLNQVAGDTVGLVTSTDPQFPNASTETYEQLSDNTFLSFNDGTPATWQLNIALAVFPVFQSNTGIEELTNSGIKIFQNQPNPASKSTSITYETASSTNVSLKVFDITGKEIMYINEGNKAAGRYNINLNIADLSGGVYYYTLNAAGKSLTKKMIIIE